MENGQNRIGVVVPEGVVVGDLAAPCEIFGRAAGGRYQVELCGAGPVQSGGLGLQPAHGLDRLLTCHTVVVPGVAQPGAPVRPQLLEVLQDVHGQGIRLASICTGAFLLASTGLLDGLRATTHWAAAAAFRARFPAVQLDPDVLWVDEGQLLTSAGAAAGLDLCLHLVRRDHGPLVAAQAARYAVMPLERPGGQAQFIEHPVPDEPGSLQPLLVWIAANPTEDLRVPVLARRFGSSARTLARHFVQQTGSTPAAWVRRARLRRAQVLLGSTRLSIEQVAEQSGFGGPATLRQQFAAELGTTPTAYRRAWS